jgi:hypothetical protein
MDPKLMWMIVVVAAAAVVATLWFVVEKRRQIRLRQRFGPEYDRTVHQTGSERRAEAELDARARRVAGLHIRPLSEADAVRFAEAWRALQIRFVDEPSAAIAEADRLVGEVMTTRGYPLGDFDQRAADISVDHPRVVANYRAARDIARRQGRGEASTEDLRQAIIHYRALFEDLLERPDIRSHTSAAQNERELVGGRK